MMEKRNLICIGCPLGCPITVELDGHNIVSVTGNTCPRGDAYARKEVTNPTRIVTSTVRVSGSKTGAVTVSCKTRTDVSKQKIFDVIRDIKSVTVSAPVRIGDVIRPNVAGTGVDMIATKDID
jgi:CxxC motif-containing protein